MISAGLRRFKLRRIALFVISLSFLFVVFSGSVCNKANALWGDDVIPGGLPGVTNVESFIAKIESVWGSVGANAIVNRLGGASIWKQNLRRTTSVEIRSNYMITETSVIKNGAYYHAALDGGPQYITALIFYINSNVYFVIDIACGNFITEPVNILEWSVAGSSTVSIIDKNGNGKAGTTANPNDTIIWNHKLKNNGPDAISNSTVHYNLGISGFPSGFTAGVSEPGVGDIARGFEAGGTRENLGSPHNKYTPTSGDVGKKLCEKIQYDPTSYSSVSGVIGHNGRGEEVCVTVVAGNNAISATSTVNQSTATPGNSIVWQHKVNNEGPDITTVPTRSYISPSGFSSSVNIYDQTVASGAKVGNIRSFSSDTYIVKDSDVGRTLCQSVTYSAVGGSQNGSSTAACVTVKAVTSNGCRPIQTYTVPSRTYYEASTHYDPKGRSYPIPAVSIPTVATVGGSTVYSNSTTNPYTLDKAYVTNNITTAYTDGNSHTISYSEAYSHIGGYIDHYDTVYDYGWINDYSWVPVTCSGSGKTFKCTGGYYVVSGKHWGIVGSHQVYNGSTTPYSVGPYSKGSQNFGPCYDYKLDADMNSFGNKVEAGSSVSVNAMVNNTPFTQPSAFYSYYHTSSKSHSSNWQVSLLKLAPGQMPSSSFSKSKAQNNTDACNYFDPTRVYGCSSYSAGSSIFWPGSSSATNISFNVPDVTAGTKYCFAFSVNDPSNTDMSQKWSHASFSYANNCIVVVKKPKVQVWGGDLYVGRGSYTTGSKSSKIQTSTSIIQNKIYGSWGEYALSANSSIVGMASGSVFKSAPTVTGNSCDYSKLSITNAGTSVCSNTTSKGYYSNSKLIPSVTSTFTNSAGISYISGTVNVSSLSGVYKNSSTSINLVSATIPLKKWVVINAPDATVRISGDIKYDTGNMKSLSDVPQLVIIAKDISIDDNVRQVDSWLIASGAINTCSSADISYANLKTTKCNNQLTINGPVMAGRLYLNRTAGAEPNGHTGDPAEVINMRADAYLWSYARASENGSAARVVYSNEMPVRF